MTFDIFKQQRDYFDSGQTLEVPFRLAQLARLKETIQKRSNDIETALRKDLYRHGYEAFLSETLLIMTALKMALKKTKSWAAPRRVRSSILNFYSTDKVVPEPLGTTLIISPWNYPFLLTLSPLIAAISAGNCAMVKPSELSPHCSNLLAELVKETFPPEYVTVVQGDEAISQELLKNPFDKIFFTGSARVGRLVLKAAANNLTPVTLELGGKSPGLVSASADLKIAARRLVWGKFINAGQTCIAPDYVLAQEAIKDELIEHMISTIGSFYGPDIRSNPDYPRIINRRAHLRLSSYLDPAKIVFGGDHQVDDLYFSPTIMDGVTWEDKVMQEEIFGPILPVLTYQSLEDAVGQMKKSDTPLALYLFSNSSAEADFIWTKAKFGGGCVNDVISHILNERLPFGGTGTSGMGAYHGRWGFDDFSHLKSRLSRSVIFDVPLRYPPYAGKERFKFLSRWI